MTYIIHDMAFMGLTKGSLTNVKAWREDKQIPKPTSTRGINPIALALATGIYTFIARSYCDRICIPERDNKKAIDHKGMAL